MTGGGDAPGLNGIIEASSRVLLQNGVEVVGIRDGFEGIFEGRTVDLGVELVRNAHAKAGTLLGSSNRSRTEGRVDEFRRGLEKLKLDGLIACGGDGTFEGLSRVKESLKIIGVPKTIDNDLAGTDITFGYDTACAVVADAVDALRFTAEAHDRIMVVETMGRTAGWIALGGGLASYADAILIPERPFDRAKLLSFVRAKKESGQRSCLVVVAEGALAAGESARIAYEVADSPQKERYGGVGHSLARWLDEQTGWEARHVQLGHLQRARPPTTTDRFLTLAMGVEAARAALEGAWGQAIVYRDGLVTRAPITDLMRPPRRVDPEHRWVRLARALGTFI